MLVVSLIILVLSAAQLVLASGNNDTTLSTTMTTTMTTETATTTTTAAENSSTFVSIGSNLKGGTVTINDTTTTNSSGAVLVHAVNAQARKIEMTKLSSVDAASSLLKNQTPPSAGAFAISTTMIAIIVALIAVVIVSVLVGTAVFVMRRRFSIWRLNNSKQNLNEIGGGGGSGSSSSTDSHNGDGGESGSAVSSNEEMIKSTSSAVVDNTATTTPVAPTSATAESHLADVVATATETSATAVPNDDECLEATGVDNKNDTLVVTTTNLNENENAAMAVAPTSGTNNTATAFVETTNEVKGVEEEINKSEQPQDTSSQSLIVNVLNELSESIANKLESKLSTETDTKQTPNGTTD